MKKNPNLDQFHFPKNVTPPSYRNKMQLLYDKYLQFGYFCFFFFYRTCFFLQIPNIIVWRNHRSWDNLWKRIGTPLIFFSQLKFM